jgi:hypothetical protein
MITTDQVTIGAPRVAFLGVCERASQVTHGAAVFFAQNIIGLKKVVASFIFPYVIDGMQFVFSVYDPENFKPAQINFLSEDGSLVLGVRLAVTGITPLSARQTSQDTESKQGSTLVVPQAPGWATILYRVEGLNAIVQTPRRLTAMLSEEGRDICIGTLDFIGLAADPLSPDRTEAIRSDPHAIKSVRIGMVCRLCGAKCQAYAGLEKLPTLEAEGWAWYETLPEEFTCSCAHTKIDLTFIRRNLHALLGGRNPPSAELSVSRLYEKSTLQEVAREFGELLDDGVQEERIHQFIKANPILLSQFSPFRILHKPRS